MKKECNKIINLKIKVKNNKRKDLVILLKTYLSDSFT